LRKKTKNKKKKLEKEEANLVSICSTAYKKGEAYLVIVFNKTHTKKSIIYNKTHKRRRLKSLHGW
jgi:hypothetical protein